MTAPPNPAVEAQLKRRRPLPWIMGLLCLAGAAWGVKTAYNAGEFKSLHPHFDGDIQTIEGIAGPEDITIDRATRTAIISADDRFQRLQGNANAAGGIYTLDMRNPDAQPVLVLREPENPIAPHGISLVALPSGRKLLYVIDHFASPASTPTNRILRYEYFDAGPLRLLQEYADGDHLLSPNDIAGVDETRFYFTNDHGARTPLGRTTEDYLQLANSNVVYYDGQVFRVVASGIAYANGIALSPDQAKVFVAGTIDQSIHIFDRNPTDGSLTKSDQVYVGSGVDNIELDEAGNLWVACHPKLLTFVRHSRDISRLSPSQVFKISETGNHTWKIDEVFLDAGNQLSASSVAAVDGNVMLVGAVFDSKMLRCELK